MRGRTGRKALPDDVIKGHWDTCLPCSSQAGSCLCIMEPPALLQSSWAPLCHFLVWQGLDCLLGHGKHQPTPSNMPSSSAPTQTSLLLQIFAPTWMHVMLLPSYLLFIWWFMAPLWLKCTALNTMRWRDLQKEGRRSRGEEIPSREEKRKEKQCKICLFKGCQTCVYTFCPLSP